MRYECRQCREAKGSVEKKVLLAQQSRELPSDSQVVRAPITFDVKTTVAQLTPYLQDEIIWQVKSLWASEYQAIAVDGVRIFLDAKKILGQGWEDIVLTKDSRIPDWVLYRSARWMRFVKNSIREHEKEKNTPVTFDLSQVQQFFTAYSHISSLVNDAKNAASFMYLACIYLRLDVKTQCKYRDRLRALVVPTDTNGTCQFPKDSLNIISPFIQQLEQNDVSQEETAVEALMRLVTSDNSEAKVAIRNSDAYAQSPEQTNDTIFAVLPNDSIQKKQRSQDVAEITSSILSNDSFQKKEPLQPYLQMKPIDAPKFIPEYMNIETEVDKEYPVEIPIEKSTINKAGLNAHEATTQTLESQPTTLSNKVIEPQKLETSSESGTFFKQSDEKVHLHPNSFKKSYENALYLQTPKIKLHHGAKPLKGWGERIKSASGKVWHDPRKCCLCMLCGDDDAGIMGDAGASTGAGRLLPIPGGSWIHANCALWSSEVWDAGRGQLKAVDKAKTRGGKLKCFGCGRSGASIGCAKPACSCNYHFLCAIACGAVFTETKNIYCLNHGVNADSVLSTSDTRFEVMRTLKVVLDEDLDKSSSSCIRIGTLLVHSLGSIEQDIDGFHSVEHITPNGYVATRIFWSSKTPRTRTLYVMKIDKGINRLPAFSIIPADNLKISFTGRSAPEAYDKLMRCVQEVNKDYFSQHDLFSNLPMCRTFRTNPPDFMLNGSQVRISYIIVMKNL